MQATAGHIHTWWPLGPWNLSNCPVPTSFCLVSLSIPIPTITIPWPTSLAILANFPFIAPQRQEGLIHLHCSSPPKLANHVPSLTTTLPTIVTLSMDFPFIQWPTHATHSSMVGANMIISMSTSSRNQVQPWSDHKASPCDSAKSWY